MGNFLEGLCVSNARNFEAAMGRPRSVFLDVELPAERNARRKILKNLYNKNRNLSLNYLKVFFVHLLQVWVGLLSDRQWVYFKGSGDISAR